MLGALLLTTFLAPQVVARPVSPQWPDITLAACPIPAPPQDLAQRKWEYGQSERDDYAAVAKAKDFQQAAALLDQFAQKYPKSDYHGRALLLELLAYVDLKDPVGQVKVAEDILRAPSADATAQTAGFATLAGVLSVYVHAGDPRLTSKLTDLQSWTRCGSQASGEEVKAPNQSQETFDNNRRYVGGIFDRTDGYVAFLKKDYASAVSYLQSAQKASPQDALTNLWLGDAELVKDPPDLNAGVFYIARTAELIPDTPSSAEMLRQVYVIVHGNDKGLDQVRKAAKSNTVPPTGFNVLPKPKQQRHYGAAVAVSAIVGLLVYAAVQHPGFTEALGQSLTPSGRSSGAQSSVERKVMIFGGPDHRTYLGCLSCNQDASDSVFNETGRYGSRYQQESVWNPYSDFGSDHSQYSACNPHASEPPIMVDQDGQSYGRLSVNHYLPGIGAGAKFYDWLASAVCKR